MGIAVLLGFLYRILSKYIRLVECFLQKPRSLLIFGLRSIPKSWMYWRWAQRRAFEIGRTDAFHPVLGPRRGKQLNKSTQSALFPCSLSFVNYTSRIYPDCRSSRNRVPFRDRRETARRAGAFHAQLAQHREEQLHKFALFAP